MTRKQQRGIFLAAGLAALGGATALVLSAFSDNLVFFYSPTDVKTKPDAAQRRLRIGGLVEPASLVREEDGHSVQFRVTDRANDLTVTFAGPLPDLFREGQGVVVEGRLRADGVFAASSVLAKHDENYMPREVADALKQSGHWKEGEEGGPAPPAGSPTPSNAAIPTAAARDPRAFR